MLMTDDVIEWWRLDRHRGFTLSAKSKENGKQWIRLENGMGVSEAADMLREFADRLEGITPEKGNAHAISGATGMTVEGDAE